MLKLSYEIFASLLVIVTLISIPFLVYGNNPWSNEEEFQVIHLTALSNGGIWTDEEVTSFNYGIKNFRKAHIVLHVNEKILLRLSSADVIHTFYVPELNIGPIEIQPGHVEEVILKSNNEGSFVYYCTTVCGDCHFYMQGTITVLSNEDEYETSSVSKPKTNCNIHNLNAEINTFIDFGKKLFNVKGCITCHGENGVGGINNPNYVNKKVPELNTLAEKLKIYWEDDADIIIDLLEKNINLSEFEDKPPIKRYNRFLAQYESIMAKINDGAFELQKLNPEGPKPPLYMPSWEHHLDKRESNAIMAFLIKQYPWENYD